MGAFADVTFSTVRFKEGYDIGAVDGFLARIDAGAVTADEVEHAIFPTVRFHTGYDVDEVDDYLDTVVARLRGSTADRTQTDQSQTDQPWTERAQTEHPQFQRLQTERAEQTETMPMPAPNDADSGSDPVIFFH